MPRLFCATANSNAATGGPFIAQITRGDAEALGLQEGDTVYVYATRVPPIAGEAAARSNAGGGAAKDETTVSSA